MRNELHALTIVKAKPDGSVLIQAGEGDDALFYLSRLGPVTDSGFFQAHFHATSLIVERTRLHGSALVRVHINGVQILGELRSNVPGLVGVKENRCVLLLELYDEAEHWIDHSQPFHPMT